MTYISAGTTYDRSEVFVWERLDDGKRVRRTYPAPYYFFVRDEKGKFEDIYGHKLTRYDFGDYESFNQTAHRYKNDGQEVYESDISPEYKVLSAEYYGKEVGKLNMTMFDLEVDYDPALGFAGPENPYAPISAASIYHHYKDKMIVYVVPPDKKWTMDKIPAELQALAEIVICKNERELLTCLLEEFENSDILSGWNSEGYDIPYLYERLKKVFGIKIANRMSFDGARPPKYKEVTDKNGLTKQVLMIYGRIHIDYMQLFMKFAPGERDSYSLESVAEEELDDMEKLEYEGSLADLYNNNFLHFLRYNIRDCEILKGFEDRKGYLALSVLLSHMDAAQVQDVIGTIKLTELSVINYCHYTLSRRVPDTNRDIDPNSAKFKGADVLVPRAGLHELLASIDVNSLYPSMMRSINISPEVLVGQFRHNADDWVAIRDQKDKVCILELEDGTQVELHTSEWPSWMIEHKYALSAYGTVFDQSKQGIIPALLTMWFTSRKEYKKKAAIERDTYTAMKAAGNPDYKKHENLYKYYDQVQNIFKLKLNSTYGATGNRHFKFFDVRLAESTTRSGVACLYHMAKTIGKLLEGEYAYPNKSVIYGDTDSCYFLTHADDIDEAQLVANAVADEINKSFPKLTRDVFFCNEGYDNLVAVSQEIVANRAIFIAGKKGYMLHALRKDGKPADEIKVTGLQIKKTTTPKPIRVKLTEYMEKFLRGADWESDIGIRLLELRESVVKSNDLTVLGLPKGVKKFEDYVSRYNAQEPGLRVPGHVMPAMLWNKCVEQYEDKQSLSIVSGMKLRIFYLTKMIGKFKSIAIPGEQKDMPEWFMQHFYKLIDRDAQAKRLVNGPMKAILKAIGKTIPTRKTLLIDELFE